MNLTASITRDELDAMGLGENDLASEISIALDAQGLDLGSYHIDIEIVEDHTGDHAYIDREALHDVNEVPQTTKIQDVPLYTQAQLKEMIDRQKEDVTKNLHRSINAEIVACQLYVLNLQHCIERAMEKLPSDYCYELSEALDYALDLKGQLSESYETASEYSRNIRYSQIEDLGLAGGLAVMVEKLKPEVPFKFVTDIDKELKSEDATATAIYMIAKEAVTNAIKYAEATEVSISLWREGANICLSVIDDGVGFDTSSGTETTCTSMRTIAAKQGGKVFVESTPGVGTKVTTIIPESGES